MAVGILEELQFVDFGDKRLNRRLQKVSKALYEAPTSSINHACGSWGDTKAAYRLFSNPKTKASEILESHRIQTMNRVAKYDRVLAIQDTTFFNYEHHPSKQGMGSIQSRKAPTKGLLAHNTLITTLDGLPLGLADQKIYARENKNKRSSPRDPIETKESYRWIEPLDTLRTLISDDIECIVVGDRESDIYEFMDGCLDHEFDFVIRSTHNRIVGEKAKRWGENKNINEGLLDFSAKLKVAHQGKLTVKDKDTKKDRIAKVSLRFGKFDLPAPWRVHDSVYDRPSLNDLYVVEVKEDHPPKGSEKIHWRLITSLPVESVNNALEVVSIYQKRWVIEIYHRVLKSGCKVEDVRLETADRLIVCLTLYSVIAWRLFWIQKLNELDPQMPCSIAFDKQEWTAIYKSSSKQKSLPQRVPTINDIVMGLAKLGGFMARKSDGHPGITVIWRGWNALHNYLSMAYG